MTNTELSAFAKKMAAGLDGAPNDAAVWHLLDAIKRAAPEALSIWQKAGGRPRGKVPQSRTREKVRQGTHAYKAKLYALLYADWLFTCWIASGMRGEMQDMHGLSRPRGSYRKDGMPTVHGWCKAQEERLKDWGMQPLEARSFREIEKRYSLDAKFRWLVFEHLTGRAPLLDERMKDMDRLLRQVDGEGGERDASEWFIPPS